jgi:hypothetical protein
MNVLMISPGYPDEMPYFCRALSWVGANVYGISDQPLWSQPQLVRDHLAGYLQSPTLWDEDAVVQYVLRYAAPLKIDRVVCLWEPGMILAARLREALGTPGMTVAETLPFRDKDVMKNVLAEAGIRTPHHARAAGEKQIAAAAKKIGYPVILKPLAGAGSADTHRVNSASDLKTVLPQIAHLPEVDVEEFIDGEEYTFDTICVNGEIKYYSMTWYRPRPLVARTNEWISPQILMLRDVEADYLAEGREMGRAVLRALKFRTGFTHMEWYKKANGEVVFGEIAARPPGANSVDVMNYASNIDLYVGWAEARVHLRFTQPVERKYNAAIIYKRAQGEGQIREIHGVEALRQRYGDAVVVVNLLPIGAHRRNWKQTLISDGYLIVRHPDLDTLLEIADAAGTDVNLYAG